MKKTYLLFVLICMMGATTSAQSVFPFQDTTLSDDERVDNLLSLMTIDEKVNALSTHLGISRLGVRNTGHSEGLHGLALGGPGNWGGRRIEYDKVIPLVYHTTTFPQAYGLGETWDKELIQKVADLEAEEIRYYAQNERYAKSGLVMRAPNADIARDPRWGRTEESFGEDPHHVAQMTIAFIKGLQGDNPKYWKAASLMKHFLANSNEDGRDSTSSNFDKRLFNEYYAYPFRKGIEEGGSRAYMAAYNSWNGIPMTIHPVMEEVTRKQWGNNGIICTDGGALDLLIKAHKTFDNHIDGAEAIIKAGVGQFLDTYVPYVYKALERGTLTEKDIDKAIRGNYIVALRLGLLDVNQTNQPYSHIGVTDTIAPWTKESTKEFVRHVTAKSVVLLKNERNTLPLSKKALKKVAVIGPRANEVLLDWYSGTPQYTITILEGIKNTLKDYNVEILFAESNEMDKAYTIAKEADIAIVCVGNHVYGTDPKWKYSPVPSDGREGVDRKALSLEQEDLAKIVYKANPKTIAVLVSSFPFAINWSQENLPAIVHITNNSQELGNGLADVLFGDYNPAGRTNQTWVKSIADLPPMMDYDITKGRTYMYTKTEPLYAFGYGLSYTTFEYSNLRVSANNISENENIIVSVDIKNAGKRDGDEVVQFYASHPNSKVSRPIKQLKGFERITIEKGATKTIEFELTSEDLSYWNLDADKYTLEKGRINIMLGASSDDVRLQKQITVK